MKLPTCYNSYTKEQAVPRECSICAVYEKCINEPKWSTEMVTTYVTFGQVHVHHINGKTFDKDCVATIRAQNAEEGRKIAEDIFGMKFCFTYAGLQFDKSSMKYYPRGLIALNSDDLRSHG